MQLSAGTLSFWLTPFVAGGVNGSMQQGAPILFVFSLVKSLNVTAWTKKIKNVPHWCWGDPPDPGTCLWLIPSAARGEEKSKRQGSRPF